MPRATCRCGHQLSVPEGRDERIVCPNCGAKVRVRSRGPSPGPSQSQSGSGPMPTDGYPRFSCPCGRRLKVSAEAPPSHGKCPDCGRIVPVPTLGDTGPEARTEELRPEEAGSLEQWSAEHRQRGSRVPTNVPPGASAPSSVSPSPADQPVEAGLRLCPNCGRPVHLGSETCRHCGTSVPRR